MYRILYIFIFLTLTEANIYSLSIKYKISDTLLFQKNNNTKKIFKIPLNEYPVFIKLKTGEKKDVIIKNLNDSVLLIRTYTHNRENRRTVYEKTMPFLRDTAYSLAQIDSINKELMYCKLEKVSIDQINYISIPYTSRKEMIKKMNFTGWLVLGWITSTVLVAIFSTPIGFAVFESGGIGIATYALIIDHKKLKLKKWKTVK